MNVELSKEEARSLYTIISFWVQDLHAGSAVRRSYERLQAKLEPVADWQGGWQE